MSHANTRKTRAVWAVALWVVGFELLPVAHLAGHERVGAHRHEGAGTSFFSSAGTEDSFRSSLDGALESLGGASSRDAGVHRHGAVAHEHGAQGSPLDSQQDDRADGAAEPSHGAHSVAHRDLAAAGSPAPAPAPAPAREVLPLAQAEALTLALSRRVSTLRARGPPA